MSREAAGALRRYWETLTPAALDRLDAVYASDVYFRDPFNELRGLPALRRVLERMFASLDSPRFRITEVLVDGDAALLVWDFEFRIRALPKRARRIHGVSHVRFAPDGRVAWHRDYWDAAGELYVGLPLLGPLMRWLARRMG